MIPKSLLSTLLLAIAVSANSVIVERSLVTLPFAKSINLTDVQNLLQRDQNRVKFLRAQGEARAAGVPLNNDAVISSPADNQGVSYIASVGVGSPATTFNLVIDTGSSNTWVGATTQFTQTSTTTQTSDQVSVRYGSGSFSGNEVIDQVTLGSGLVIDKQSIGVATTSTGFTGVDGILGIGPVDLTVGTLSPNSRNPIPTVTDNLATAGTISANQIGISFEPLTSSSGEQLNGEITWGGTDSSKFTGSITFTPITSTSPASKFWGINQTVKYGSTTILSNAPGIVDTGTTLTLLATDAYQKYQAATGGVFDNNAQLLSITSSQFSRLQPLSFIIGGTTFNLTPNAQIWPRNLNPQIGGSAGQILLIVQDAGSNSGTGLDFINGQTFLERFYSVFDTDHRRVGLATTPFTNSNTN